LQPLLSKEYEIELIRDDIHVEPVPYWFIDRHNNGYIKISRFTEGGIFEIKSLISIMIKQGIDGLIIDLRDNPGGLLYESIETTALFLDKGDKIVETRSRNNVAVNTYEAREDGIYNDRPLVVLINGQTASAAEILAGAIQDNDRGLIVGSASFGKGLVQQILKFSDHSALKLTTAKYYTPSERCIQKDRDDNDLIEKAQDNRVLYYTNSGRPVFGGGGIIPDIYVESFDHPPLIDEIVALGLVNDFAGEYADNNMINENFKIDDKLIDEFIDYLAAKRYVYRNELYDNFGKFKTGLSNEDMIRSLDQQLQDIEGILRENARNELLSLKPQLKDIIFENIIVVSLGENAACRLVRQNTDACLAKAGTVLKNPDTYSSLLVGY
jgi:carboxyl-terminal processing protease